MLLVGLVALAALALSFWSRSQDGIPVEVAPVRRGRVVSTITSTTSGSVEPHLRATIKAEHSARVIREHVKEGARVTAGATIISLDPKEPLEEHAAALAGLEAARAQRARAKDRIEDSERELARARALYTQKVLSRQALDAAEFKAKVEQRTLQEANASLGQLERKARLARIRLDKAEVRAPFPGIITRLHVDQGDSVTPGTALFEIADDSRIHIEAPIDEIDAAKVREGQEARLVPDAYPDQKFSGRIYEIAPVVSTGVETNRTVMVKITLDAPQTEDQIQTGRFKIGMSVDVEVILAEAKSALYVPTFAVIERGGRNVVLIADGSRARERSIETGLSNWETTEVKSGLSEGDRVITTLNDKRLEDGQRITVEPSDPERERG